MQKNVDKAIGLLRDAIDLIPTERWCRRHGFDVETGKLKARLRIKDAIAALEAVNEKEPK